MSWLKAHAGRRHNAQRDHETSDPAGHGITVDTMSEESSSPPARREELLSLLSTSGTLAGLCITVVAFMNTFDKTRSGVSVVDDLFAVCAAVFLLCIYFSFWALKTRALRIAVLLVAVADVLFLAALTTMTVAAFIMVYTIL